MHYSTPRVVSMMMERGRWIAVVKKLLKREGFEVEIGGALKGSSGLVHIFDIVASRGELMLCFDYVSDLESLLKVLGKTLDVDHVRVYAVSEAGTAKLLPIAFESERPRFLLFEDERDLASKVRSELGSYARQRSLKP